jgi:hypothetical protein
MSTNDEDLSVEVSKTKARGGVTGHNVRYVLAFGLLGVVVAFVALGIYYGLGDKPNTAPGSVTTPRARRVLPPQGNDIARIKGAARSRLKPRER